MKMLAWLKKRAVPRYAFFAVCVLWVGTVIDYHTKPSAASAMAVTPTVNECLVLRPGHNKDFNTDGWYLNDICSTDITVTMATPPTDMAVGRYSEGLSTTTLHPGTENGSWASKTSDDLKWWACASPGAATNIDYYAGTAECIVFPQRPGTLFIPDHVRKQKG
jgi:hypothetical protein